MRAQVTVLTVHGNQNLGLHQSMHGLKIWTVRVTRYVIGTAIIIHNIDANLRQLVDDLNHTALIAWNGFGGEQEQITLFQFMPAVFTIGQLCRGRPTFTLAACHQEHQISAWDIQSLLRADHWWKIRQNPGFK